MRLALLVCFVVNATFASATEFDVWIGIANPATGDSAGIYHLSFDDEKGKLSQSTLVAEQQGAGFLAKHPRLPVLYSTGGQAICSWKISRDASGVGLQKINELPTGDGGSAHIGLDRTGRVLLSAQYGGGSVVSFPLNEDGAIGSRASKIEHDEPSGVVQGRQESCHPHWVGVSPDNRFVLVPDLGADKIFVHKLDATTAKLTRHGSVDTPAGGGPRHYKFHPHLPVGYVVNELSMAVTVLAFEADAGSLAVRQTIPTLSAQQLAGERFNSGSEIRVHPSGKFVYSANRGHDTITAFAVDMETGQLTLIEQEPIRGSWPRNFNLDPSGRWLLAAGRDSNTLAVFQIDQHKGELQYVLESAQVPAPICVLVKPQSP